MKRECSTSFILALLLTAGSLFPLSADAQRIRPSIVVGAGSGSVTYAQVQVRTSLEFGHLAIYGRVFGRRTSVSCEDLSSSSCTLPGQKSSGASVGLSFPVGLIGSWNPHLDLGLGLISWDGTDPSLEAELGFPLSSGLVLGMYAQAVRVGERSGSPAVPERWIGLIGLQLGMALW
jgi:hypothetical protein